jgi:hypothetical protein
MFTPARLVEALGIDSARAESIIGLVRGTVDPFSLPGVAAWRDRCYHAPRADRPEVILHAIDEVLGTCGTETIRGDVYDAYTDDIVAEYCNAGDTYAVTILYDYMRREYRLMSYGDWVEKYGDRYGVQ